jgi:hypothetical protein
LDVAITSDDETVHAYAEAIPFPIQATNNGCTVFVKPVMPPHLRPLTAFGVSGEGFEPNAKISSDGRSGMTENETQVKTDQDGRFRSLLIPYLGPRDLGGHYTDTFVGRSCNVTVDFDWGKVALKEVQ